MLEVGCATCCGLGLLGGVLLVRVLVSLRALKAALANGN